MAEIAKPERKALSARHLAVPGRAVDDSPCHRPTKANLEEAAELHPEHLSAWGLSLRIVGNPDDSREIETAAQAIDGLREFGLFKVRDDEIVEPTTAALRAVALLT